MVAALQILFWVSSRINCSLTSHSELRNAKFNSRFRLFLRKGDMNVAVRIAFKANKKTRW